MMGVTRETENAPGHILQPDQFVRGVSLFDTALSNRFYCVLCLRVRVALFVISFDWLREIFNTYTKVLK